MIYKNTAGILQFYSHTHPCEEAHRVHTLHTPCGGALRGRHIIRSKISHTHTHTGSPFTARKFMPDSVASALAMRVLLQPGGPYNSTPRGGDMPILKNASGCRRGHSTICADRPFVVVTTPDTRTNSGKHNTEHQISRSAQGHDISLFCRLV